MTGLLDSAKDFKARYMSEIRGKIDFLVKIIKKSRFLSKSRKNTKSINDLKKLNRAHDQELWFFHAFADFQIGHHLNWWIDERPQSIFFFINRERVKIHYITKKAKLYNCSVILMLGWGKVFRVILNYALFFNLSSSIF